MKRMTVCLIVFVVVPLYVSCMRLFVPYTHPVCIVLAMVCMYDTFYVCVIVFIGCTFVRVVQAVVRIVHTPCMYSACFGMCGTFYVCLIVFVVVPFCVSSMRWFVLYIRPVCIMLASVCVAGSMFVELFLWLCVSCMRLFVLYIRPVCIVLASVCLAGCMFV